MHTYILLGRGIHSSLHVLGKIKHSQNLQIISSNLLWLLYRQAYKMSGLSEARPAVFDWGLKRSHHVIWKMRYEPFSIRATQVLLDVCLKLLLCWWILPYSSTDAPGEIKQVIITHNGDEVIILLPKCCGGATSRFEGCQGSSRTTKIPHTEEWGQLHRQKDRKIGDGWISKTQSIPVFL